jgi:hypothetical protein
LIAIRHPDHFILCTEPNVLAAPTPIDDEFPNGPAESVAALSPRAFAVTKSQMRQPVAERTASNARDFDEAVVGVWTAQDTLGYVRDYVAKTLKK